MYLHTSGTLKSLRPPLDIAHALLLYHSHNVSAVNIKPVDGTGFCEQIRNMTIAAAVVSLLFIVLHLVEGSSSMPSPVYST